MAFLFVTETLIIRCERDNNSWLQEQMSKYFIITTSFAWEKRFLLRGKHHPLLSLYLFSSYTRVTLSCFSILFHPLSILQDQSQASLSWHDLWVREETFNVSEVSYCWSDSSRLVVVVFSLLGLIQWCLEDDSCLSLHSLFPDFVVDVVALDSFSLFLESKTILSVIVV